MKNLRIIPFVMIVMLLAFSSCEDDATSKLVGEWALFEQDGEEVDKNVTFKFYEDGKFKGYKEDELVNDGYWELKEDQLILKKDGDSYTMKVEKLDRGVLILIEDLGDFGERKLEFMWVE